MYDEIDRLFAVFKRKYMTSGQIWLTLYVSLETLKKGIIYISILIAMIGVYSIPLLVMMK